MKPAKPSQNSDLYQLSSSLTCAIQSTEVNIQPSSLSRSRTRFSTTLSITFALILGTGLTDLAFAQEPRASSQLQGRTAAGAEQVNVDAIKKKYWARGDETELGVVQNRTYSKDGKFEISGFGGVAYSDPFLDVKTLGGSLGYHFSEYLSVNLIGWKSLPSSSTALKTFEDVTGATTNTNPPNFYLGLEGAGSIFYGKLSVLGKAIIYYDFLFLAGLGITDTKNGRYFTPSLGIGQRYYLSRFWSIRLDYRLQYYREAIIETQVITTLGTVRDHRNNWTNNITLGVGFMF